MMRKRRRRVFGLLIIPFAALVWCVGWSLCWVGDVKEKLKPKLPSQMEKLTLAAILPHPKLKLRSPGYVAKTQEKIGSTNQT